MLRYLDLILGYALLVATVLVVAYLPLILLIKNTT